MQAPGQVKYSSVDPTKGAGTVYVQKQGTYTIACGYKATGCSIAVIPYGGGELLTTYQVAGPAPACGKWGPISPGITGLKTGQYLVTSAVTMQGGAFNQAVYASAESISITGGGG